QKCFYIVGGSIKFILAVLNSSINFYYFKTIGASLGDSGYEMSKIFVKLLPIPNMTPLEQQECVNIVNKILAITKSQGYSENSQEYEQVKSLMKQIDNLLYSFYELSDEQIKLIESTTDPS